MTTGPADIHLKKSASPGKDPVLDLAQHVISLDVLKLIPQAAAIKHTLLPLYREDEILHVAMVDPKDLFVIDEMRRITQVRAVIPHAFSRPEILSAIDRCYHKQHNVQDIVQEIHKEKLEAGEIAALASAVRRDDLASMAEQAPVIKLVNQMILHAIHDNVSDIHFEPEEDKFRVRFRLDGILQESYTFKKDIESAILARVKITSGMDIAERRKPQDGRMKMVLESKTIDVRVSSLPTLYGENIVLRLLDKTSVSKDLKDLGMEGRILKDFSRLIRYPYGVLLVTGPTGSGKSTTLYAALSTINDMEKNIVTVEDPIEYNIELVRQTQVNPKIGLTFASGLRSILRQDPDVIMVGEIRDLETAEIAVQAALTGHLVLSTLHTNDATGAVTRLTDMGIQPFLISSSVIGILAQRLIRKLCAHCKAPAATPENLLAELGVSDKRAVFYDAKGCEKCRHTKYSGRTSIHEFFVMTDEIRELITKRASELEIRSVAQKQGMKTLREAGLEKARLGITSIEEVLDVTALQHAVE